jgi:hypothetical protein
MDCPACQSFNSILDAKCSDCEFPLPPPRRAGVLYRRAAAFPERGVRARIRRWARLALGRGEARKELASVLVRRGYDESWSRELVSRVEPLRPERVGVVAFWAHHAGRFARSVLTPGNRRNLVLVAAALLFLSHENTVDHTAGGGGDTGTHDCSGELAMGLSATCP